MRPAVNCAGASLQANRLARNQRMRSKLLLRGLCFCWGAVPSRLCVRAQQPPKENNMKKLIMTFVAAGLLTVGAANLSAQTNETAPKSVIHVVTVAWKEGTTPEQIQAALDGAKALPAQYKGITRVWTKPLKVQNIEEAKVKKTHVIVMEFADEAALKNYSDSPAQKEWYKAYVPIRGQSTTYDISN
jgi:hypothetical protein